MVYEIRHSNRKQQGFSLIEVLVAMIILSIGLLALTALQLSSLRATNEAQTVTSITLLAKEMADRMRANPSAIASYVGTSVTESTNNGDDCDAEAVNLTPAQLRAYDVNEWICGLENLGLVRGTIDQTNAAPDEYTIAVQWNENRDAALPAVTECDANYDETKSNEKGCFKLRFNP